MNIYELINQVKLNTGNLRYWPIVNLKDVELENIGEKKALKILQKICGLLIIEENKKRKLNIFLDESLVRVNNCFLVKSELECLEKLNFDNFLPYFSAYIWECIWLDQRDYKAADKALDYYLIHLEREINFDESVLEVSTYAIALAKEINNRKKLNTIFKILHNIIFHNENNTSIYITLSILDILSAEHFISYYEALEFLNNNVSIRGENEHINEKFFILKRKWANKLGDSNLIISIEKDYAEYFEKLFNFIPDKDYFKQERFLINAIDSYTRCKNRKKANELKQKLMLVQINKVNNMKIIEISIDSNISLNTIEEDLKKLNFIEIIFYSLKFIKYLDFDIVKNMVKDCKSSGFISDTFPCSIINDRGQSTDIFMPLMSSDYENNSTNLRNHVDHMVMRYADVAGCYLKHIYSYIKDTFIFSEYSFDFLIRHNEIVPATRNKIFRNVLFLIFQGELCTGYQVLVLQLENLFRYIAQEQYGLTYKIDKDGRTEEYTLWDILNYLIKNSEDNNKSIFWQFQCLLCQSLGGNIRNNIAHGLVEEYDFETGRYCYLLCLVILLLVRYADFYNEND